jgi:excisionase family DNA binding protein
VTFEDAPKLLKVEEAAELLRCHSITVYRKLEKGEWSTFAWKLGQEWRIERDGLEQHLRKQPLREPVEDPMPRKRRARFDALVASEMKGAA